MAEVRDPELHARILTGSQERFRFGRERAIYFYREMVSTGVVFMIEGPYVHSREQFATYEEAEARWLKIREEHAVELALHALGIDQV